MPELLTGKDYLARSEQAMRDVYAKTMVELGGGDDRIVVLDVDCSRSMGSKAFHDAYPSQYINVGIQEANAVGVAAGLSVEGQIPFLNAFGVFATRRTFDQVFLSCGYARQNVKIIGWDAGIGAETNGGTHMPFEDVGIMRCVPGMVVVEPADTVAFEGILREAAAWYGNVYIRCLRKQVSNVYRPGAKFPLGKAALVRQGDDATIIANGMMVAEALIAADMLAEKGISARVVDMYTIKPLDEETVLNCARETGALVTAENHRTESGLASAVASCLATKFPCGLEAVGVGDEYGEVGNYDYLKRRFGLQAKDIVDKAVRAVARKKTGAALNQIDIQLPTGAL